MSVVPYVPSIQGKRGSSRQRKSNRSRKSKPIVPVNAASYAGPSRLPRGVTEKALDVVQLGIYGSVASSAGGVISTVFNAGSQTTSSNDWTSYQNLYQEYRILSMKVHLVPWNKYNQPTTSALAPVLSVTTRDSSTALSTLADTATYDSVQVHAPSSDIVRTIQMDGIDEASWTLTSTTPPAASTMYVKLYSSGNVASTTLYDYLTICIVQFRGRK